MMIKEPSGNSTSLKVLLVIPVVVLFLLAISACEMNISLSKSENNTVVSNPAVNQPIDIATSPVYTEIKSVEAAPAPPPPPPPVPQNKVATAENVTDNTQTKTNPVGEEVPQEIFVVVETMPQFPGGEAALMKFIYDNIQYPQAAKDKGISGRVILRFAVMADGNVNRVMVLKGVDPELDQEAIRVIKMLPAWQPGKQSGKPVNVWYSVPVTFQLK